MNFFWQWKVL